MTIDPAPAATLLCFDGENVHFCGQIVLVSGKILHIFFRGKLYIFVGMSYMLPKTLPVENKRQ